MRALSILASLALSACAGVGFAEREQGICTIEDQEAGACITSGTAMLWSLGYAAEHYPSAQPRPQGCSDTTIGFKCHVHLGGGWLTQLACDVECTTWAGVINCTIGCELEAPP
jgi:hypothetical protein